MSEQVILVTETDEPVGTAEKLAAHEAGRLHRAFSVFVVNDAGEILLQRRAAGKYHSPGLWSNACCSHPRPGEPTEAAARRRLREEMGFTCAMERVGALLYRADVGGGLIEHEYDHLFLARWTGSPRPVPEEVDDWRWVRLPALRRELRSRPSAFTYWFRAALPELEHLGCLPEQTAEGHAAEGHGAEEHAAEEQVA